MKKVLSWIPRLWSHWLSLLGVVLTSVSGGALLLAFLADLVVPLENVYASALLFLFLPPMFLLGLFLIPIGLLLERRRRGKGGLSEDEDSLRAALVAFFANRVARRRFWFLFLLTLVNVTVLALVGQRALSFMDTPAFCGTLCHEVMQPEYDAYLRSPHSRVACVKCHIGPGASWAVRSKVDGLRQVWRTLLGSFERPIPSPVHALRPARDTCEQCHWPAKFHGNRIAYRVHFRNDEKNSAVANVLALKVGGENPRTGQHEGIHWHVSPDAQVVYDALDERREKIGRVAVVRDGQEIAVYQRPGESGPAAETRVMDCVDCHNRPTHAYDGSSKEALDWALQTGLLDPSVPYLRKLAIPLLAREDRPREGAEEELRGELAAAYQESYPALRPSDEVIARAAAGLATLYRRNIYPDMKIGWDTYPTHLGHRGEDEDQRGCFRCHNDEHATADGRKLSQDCELCHEMLVEEEAPGDIPASLRTLLVR